MENFINKLSLHNLLKYLFPGALFVIFINNFTYYSLGEENIILNLVLYYYIGFILSYIGLLIVEPILQKVRFLNSVNPLEFLKASIINPKINELLKICNEYRTLFSGTVVAIIIIFFHQVTFLEECIPLIILFLLFGYVYRKQTNLISFEVKRLLNNEK